MSTDAEANMKKVLAVYQNSFSTKVHGQENSDLDPLMSLFGITPELKRENRQYWGRELGMCWQLVVTELFKELANNFAPPYRDGADELCDLIDGTDAIDTKYRIGSGDSGTLKKFKQYAKTLKQINYRPVLLIVRDDNLPAAITACINGGWTVLTGDDTWEYVEQRTGFDLKTWFVASAGQFPISN